jgi:hypothetical protein
MEVDMSNQSRKVVKGAAGLIGILLWFVSGVIGASTGLRKK